MRLFVALPLFPFQRIAVEKAQRALQARLTASAIKWVAPENIHLTLQFMGEVDSGRVRELEAALQRDCASLPPLELEIAGLGCFPHARHPRVIWVGVNGDTVALCKLQRAAAAAVEPFHGQPTEKHFTPHLTLARVKSLELDESRRIGRELSQTQFPASIPWRVICIQLIESKLTPQGAHYSVLREVKLTG